MMLSTAIACQRQNDHVEISRMATYVSSPDRRDAIRRAKVWTPTDVERQSIKAGPDGPGAFQFLQTVHCQYENKVWEGHSSKFGCDVGPGDLVKVKFGKYNGEVYGEVAATRLLWALGFGADRMYPVRVFCRGCPDVAGGTPQPNGDRLFDPAVIERKMSGAEFPDDPGWSWSDLDLVDEHAGGATRAERDALKLVAVLIQDTDTKSVQQRLVCQDLPATNWPERCAQPFMMLNDVGLTFGRANGLNANPLGSVNFTEWMRTPIWKHTRGCTGNLPMSLTGTLGDPLIGEQGRQFLATLLARLSDRQIRELFEVSRFELRPPSPDTQVTGEGNIDDWVAAFKRKRDEIAGHHCHDAPD